MLLAVCRPVRLDEDDKPEREQATCFMCFIFSWEGICHFDKRFLLLPTWNWNEHQSHCFPLLVKTALARKDTPLQLDAVWSSFVAYHSEFEMFDPDFVFLYFFPFGTQRAELLWLLSLNRGYKTGACLFIHSYMGETRPLKQSVLYCFIHSSLEGAAS